MSEDFDRRRVQRILKKHKSRRGPVPQLCRMFLKAWDERDEARAQAAEHKSFFEDEREQLAKASQEVERLGLEISFKTEEVKKVWNENERLVLRQRELNNLNEQMRGNEERSAMKLDRAWNWLGFAAVVALVAIVLSVFTMATTFDHSVRSYYLTGRSGPGFCIAADINWAEDSIVFCTDDINKALDVMRRSNEVLKGKP